MVWAVLVFNTHFLAYKLAVNVSRKKNYHNLAFMIFQGKFGCIDDIVFCSFGFRIWAEEFGIWDPLD